MNELVSQLRQILADILAGSPVTLAYLYGSAAADQMLPGSDVDIALVLCRPDHSPAMSPTERLHLEFAVEAALEQHGLLKPTVCKGTIPKMVNPAKLETLAHNLREYVAHLENLVEVGKEAVHADPYKRGAARYYLQIASECCIDIGNHVIASEQFRPPATHRETFQILNETGLVPNDFVLTLQQMASMHDRLVHLYSEVDDNIVFDAIMTAPADCKRFVDLIFDYMETSDEEAE